ncbi:hypothetical protein PAPYR_4604 [Paratrimastix pyriformis]|uniref:Uncharacterized protein n=1 Tax=Paratrimastix pyriformis TaxID=342808 RepID=A0ABQ8UJZ7_9EUKA|nr:hypothetical protein PAPYR_4604 [Paratrimastix pyriformis]
MPKESTQELRETRSGRRYPTPRHSRDDSSEEEPRGHSRKRARAEPKSSAADAAPASPLRLDTVTEDEAEQEETQRASQEHEATEQEQEETQHASQDADQHHPVVFIPSAEHSSSSEHARASVLPEPPTAEPEETPEPEQTTVPEQTTEPVPEQTTIEPLETTTTEPEVTTSDPVQATTTEPAEPSEPEPAQSELQQTGTEPEAAEQSVPGEPEQLAEPEQPAEPELTPEPEQTAAPPPTPSKQPPQRRTAPPSSSLAPPPKPRAGSPGYQEVRSRSPDIDPGNPAFTAAAGCWFNRCSQDASASGIRAFQNPTCSPCVLRLTCSPGHRHEHYCHASSSGSGSGFRASQNPTCSFGHRHEHDCHASSSGSGSGFRASQNPTCSPGHRHEHDCHASSSGSGSGFRASQNHVQPRSPPRARLQSLQQWLRIELPCLPERPAPPRVPRHQIYLVWQSETKEVLKLTRQAFYERIFPKLLASWFPSTNHLNRGLIVPVHFFETMAEYRLSGAICVELHKVLNRLGLTFGKILFSMTCGQSADIEKTYQFLTSRALMILVCLDSEAAFGVDRAVDGHMRLEELALWERTFPFYVKEVFHDRSMLELTDYYGEQFPKVFQACEREYLALSEDERKTYDWSIQCHKFRTNTCYREIPAHWDCLFKFTGSA